VVDELDGMRLGLGSPRGRSREIDPIRQWKLSETDIALLDKWDDYTAAKITMFRRTHTTEAPWTVVRSPIAGTRS
jgi:polyphosphate kinase 2 (PPK2 family)